MGGGGGGKRDTSLGVVLHSMIDEVLLSTILFVVFIIYTSYHKNQQLCTPVYMCVYCLPKIWNVHVCIFMVFLYACVHYNSDT